MFQKNGGLFITFTIFLAVSRLWQSTVVLGKVLLKKSPIPARWLWMGADDLHHWSVSAAAGASLCSCVSGVSLLQSHC